MSECIPEKLPKDLFADQRVAIIGGGVAGIAAAVRLAEWHVPVTLVETRTKLGGRATSFLDPKTKDPLDNCQHVLMGCCTNLIDLYKRLGVYDKIEWHDQLYFANSKKTELDGELSVDVMKADPLPAPLHLARAMLGFNGLTMREKIAIASAMSAIIRTSFDKRNELDSLSFLDWLKQHKQPDSAIKKYWEVVIVSACNESLDRCSTRYAMQVLQEGFLHHRDAWRMGLSVVPLLDLYDPAEALLRRAGGTLDLSMGVQSLDYTMSTGLIESITLSKSEKQLAADAFVSTVPFDRLDKLTSEQCKDADSRLVHLDKFTVSPIIGIHVYLRSIDGKAVMKLPHLILNDSPIQWIFNKGMNDDSTQHLHCVISAAYELVDASVNEMRTLVESEIRRVFSISDQVEIVHIRPVKEKRATFSVYAGLDQYRPTTSPNEQQIQNLFVAGDWVDTGWPATMEGAARSGYNAALDAIHFLLSRSKHAEASRILVTMPDTFLCSDLPSSPLYRSISKLPG
ncbi:hydroxysqualene dehydroxylase HpnE [Poriferisphaera corsica]|nr:hydroxysqualene dehydroxylase HpnE [Poriferisphaera corsica]